MKIIIIILTIFSWMYAAEALAGKRIKQELEISIEQNDSLIKLFNHDWQKVMESNRHIIFYDRHGKAMPDKLVVGERLKVGKGTYLTNYALQRLDRYQIIKAEALGELRRAEKLSASASPLLFRSLHAQGQKFLIQAKQAANTPVFKYSNYLECQEYAQKAIRYFEENLTKSTKVICLFSSLMLMLFAVILIRRRTKRKIHARDMHAWIHEQEQCLNRYLAFKG